MVYIVRIYIRIIYNVLIEECEYFERLVNLYFIVLLDVGNLEKVNFREVDLYIEFKNVFWLKVNNRIFSK